MIIASEGSSITAGEDSGIYASKNSTIGQSYSIIIGGRTHTANGQYGFIGGGAQNTVGYLSATIAGFGLNASNQSHIIGGENSTSNGAYSGIFGGLSHNATGQSSAIIGGESNSVSGRRSVVIGGLSITATEDDTVYVPNLNITGQGYSPLVDLGFIGATTTTLNFNNGNVQKFTGDGAATVTLAFSNVKAGATYIIIAVNDGDGGAVLAWPATVIWPGGVVPTWTPTAGGTDIFTIVAFSSSVQYVTAVQNFV